MLFSEEYNVVQVIRFFVERVPVTGLTSISN